MLLVVAACGSDASARQRTETDPKVEEVSDTSLVTVDGPNRFELVTVVSQPIADRLSGTCVVSPDVNRTVPVNALVAGRVVDVRATLGDHVEKGQLLATIASPDLTSAQADRQKAVADEAYARKQLDRARLLLEHGTIAQRDLETAEDAEQKAQADLRATTSRLELIGGTADHPSSLIEVRAPVSGTIIEQNVTRDAGVKSPDNSPNLFTVADLSRVWLMCDVYENELSLVHQGQIARVRLNAYADRSFAGAVANVSQVLDPSTRTAKVRVELDNPDGALRPGMFGVADLESNAARSGLTVPTTAVVQMHDEQWVFVKAGPSSFRRVHVEAGREVQPGVQQVVGGVAAGQVIVRNALQLAQATER